MVGLQLDRPHSYSRQRPTFQLSANIQPVSHIQDNWTCCKISTYWSPCLQWPSQSQSVCLLQASLHWNSSAVYPWSIISSMPSDHRIKLSCLCLLDLSAAFDTIDHNIQITRLSSWFGIQGSVLNWFESYLISRSFRVKCDKDFSSEHISSCGVPQGSVLVLYFSSRIPPHSALLSPHFL